MVHPWLFGFNERDCPEVGGGKRLYPGTQKSVRFIEGPSGRGFNNPALIIDGGFDCTDSKTKGPYFSVLPGSRGSECGVSFYWAGNTKCYLISQVQSLIIFRKGKQHEETTTYQKMRRCT